MPSFDIVSEVDKQVLTNSVDQANRVIKNRFDFKGVDAEFTRTDYLVDLRADAEIQINQMLDILRSALHKNGVDIRCLEESELSQSGKQVKTSVKVRTGVDSDLARKLVKMVKDAKLKVQAQIQGDQVRVTGKKRDDLQAVIALVKQADIELPLQFDNFRD
jgi:uncharacterized protein YajQ (UPF0234 family)